MGAFDTLLDLTDETELLAQGRGDRRPRDPGAGIRA